MDATTPDLSKKLKETNISTTSSTAPSSSTKPNPPSFTSLPTSIRNKIYAHVLDTELVNIGQPNVSYTHTLKDNVLNFKASRPPFPVDNALFYTNKEISKEAIRYFYEKNLFVRLEIYTSDARHAKTMLEDSGVLFSVADPWKVEKSTQHAMDITIVEKSSAQKRACVMFPAQYLPRLINFLDQASRTTSSWAPTQALFLTILNAYDFPLARLQGDLLELFRLLTNFGAVTIDSGNLLPGYAEGLQQNMTAASFTASTYLEAISGITDRAEEAMVQEKWDIANQHAQSGIIALTYAYLTRAETLHSQPEEFAQTIQRLRWRCELTVGKALFHLYEHLTASNKDWISDTRIPRSERAKIAEDLLAAETAASRALSLSTDSPNPSSNPWFQSLPAELIPPNKNAWFTDQERAVSWYACGLVHIALGECLFAAGDLERACGLFPEGKGFKDVFQRAREGIDWSVRPGTGMKKAAGLVRRKLD